ncbi:MAG: UPF0149 family protein [Candidatus Eisenbacteria bacterium]
MNPTTDLTPETIERLTSFLESPDRPKGTLGYVGLRGYLFAIANAPRFVPPSEWLHRIFGPNGREEMIWDGEEAVQLISTGFMAVWNDVARDPEEADEPAKTGDGPATDELLLNRLIGGDSADEAVRRDWCAGFQVGWELVESSWEDALEGVADEHVRWFNVCQLCIRYFADPEAHWADSEVSEEERGQRAERMNEIFPTALRSYARLGRVLHRKNAERRSSGLQRPVRVEKGPGRNDPCPCGSGKKYKKCCLH